MPGKRRSINPKQRGDPREARAQRILDAASALILRQGYHRTTVEEIARQAEVGKGTLYLHWETREALFSALVLREKTAMAADIQQRVVRDPAGATLPGLLKHAALALMQRPLLKAVLLRDTAVFGELVHREQDSFTAAEALAGFTSYLQALRDLGLVRSDLSLQAQGAILGSIFLGFFLAAPLLPGAFQTSDEELADHIAEAAQRTLEPRGPIPTGAFLAASPILAQFIDHSAEIAQDGQAAEIQAEAEAGPLQDPQPGTAVEKSRRAKKSRTRALAIEARRMHAAKNHSAAEICAALGISRASYYRYLKDAPEGENPSVSDKINLHQK